MYLSIKCDIYDIIIYYGIGCISILPNYDPIITITNFKNILFIKTKLKLSECYVYRQLKNSLNI